MFHFKFCIYLGSKFAPYGKDGCAGIKPEDQSDNSAMSTTGRRRGNMVNRVNSTDNQCFFEGSSHFQFAKGQKISKTTYDHLLDSEFRSFFCKN